VCVAAVVAAVAWRWQRAASGKYLEPQRA